MAAVFAACRIVVRCEASTLVWLLPPEIVLPPELDRELPPVARPPAPPVARELLAPVTARLFPPVARPPVARLSDALLPDPAIEDSELDAPPAPPLEVMLPEFVLAGPLVVVAVLSMLPPTVVAGPLVVVAVPPTVVAGPLAVTAVLSMLPPVVSALEVMFPPLEVMLPPVTFADPLLFAVERLSFVEVFPVASVVIVSPWTMLSTSIAPVLAFAEALSGE